MADALNVVAAFAAGVALTWAIIALATRTRLVAIPDARSSHSQPTPTSGGIAIVVPALIWAAWSMHSVPIAAPVLYGGVVIALLGLADDIKDLSAGVRLPVHFIVAALAVWMVSIVALPIADVSITAGWPLWIGCVFGLVWLLNLYNFMDGIDGIAAMQCVAYGAGVVVLADPGDATVGLVLVLASAALGFLVFNWAPARIFMGDVGSGFLGLVLGLVAIDLAARGVVSLIASLILLTSFWFDASYTLCARILTGQQFAAPHRTHAYQKIARRLGHGWTTTINALVTFAWLAPLAWCAMQWPSLSPAALLAAMVPYAAVCIGERAGLPEVADR